MFPTWEEHTHGETVWVAVRARGAEWSWLTKQEAVAIALKWLEAYDRNNTIAAVATNQATADSITA